MGSVADERSGPACGPYRSEDMKAAWLRSLSRKEAPQASWIRTLARTSRLGLEVGAVFSAGSGVCFDFGLPGLGTGLIGPAVAGGLVFLACGVMWLTTNDEEWKRALSAGGSNAGE